jgi:CelD/BcsL family acetyltransferase involved in cellulose biosynthesis
MTDRFSEEGFRYQPVASHTGPFPRRPFLETWWRHLGGSDELAVISKDGGSLPLRLCEGLVLFCGDADLTDYHSPLGDPAPALAAAASAFSGHRFSFDSLPEEASELLEERLAAGGHRYSVTHDAVTMVIDLTDGVDGWLARLRKKDRHEVRRKWRNFTDAVGMPHLERRDTPEAAALFADLHRTSPGSKGSFMLPEREAFFVDLVRGAGATVEILLGGSDVVAASFGFAERDGYYLYNSAYDRATAEASPGIVLLVAMIEHLAEEGVERLDLLKGDEPYKFRLGGTPRQLYRIEGTFA